VSAARLPTDRLQYRRQLLETLVKDGKWMSIDERGLVSIDRRLPVLELDMARPQTGVVSVPVNPDRKIPRRFYPVNAIVFVLDTGGVPEAEFQSRAIDVVRCPQERHRIDIRNNEAGPSTSGPIANVLTASLLRKAIVYIPKERSLRISVATSEEDHLRRDPGGDQFVARSSAPVIRSRADSTAEYSSSACLMS
jgi:hypothetical protein